jgi:hypothetical protein
MHSTSTARISDLKFVIRRIRDEKERTRGPLETTWRRGVYARPLLARQAILASISVDPSHATYPNQPKVES